jgi:hypothetical protein
LGGFAFLEIFKVFLFVHISNSFEIQNKYEPGTKSFLLKSKLFVGTQRENRALPCVKSFAVRFLSVARQRLSLPCVFPKAHDTHLRTGSSLFAVRFFTDAQQTFVFVVRPRTDARQSWFTNGCTFTPVPTLRFVVRYTKTHGTDAKFAVRLLQAHGKHVPLPCVLC